MEQIEELKKSMAYEIQGAPVPRSRYLVYFLSRDGIIVYIGKSSDRGYTNRLKWFFLG